MCGVDPYTAAASLAMTVGGSLLQNQAQSRALREADEAMQAAQVAETQRQNRYSAEAQRVWNQSADNAARPAQEQQLGDKIAARRTAYQGVVKDANPNTDLLQGQGGDQAVVQNYIVGKLQDAADKGKAEGAAKANLDGWGDLTLNNAVVNSRNAADIQAQGNFARGSASVLPLELAAARQKANNNRSLFGDLLTAGGQIGSVAAGSGFKIGDLFGGGASTLAGGGGVSGLNGSMSPKLGGMTFAL